MTTELYDLTVASYTQVLEGTVSVLEKGRDHCKSEGIDLVDVLDSVLFPNMQNFYFQVMSLNHHSTQTIEALSSGEFGPPMHAFNHQSTDEDYEMLISKTKESVAFMQAQNADNINALAGKSIVFKLGANEMPFSTENFVLSFSLPNFYFHATTAYDLLRMKGVKIGKMDFLGTMRVGN